MPSASACADRQLTVDDSPGVQKDQHADGHPHTSFAISSRMSAIARASPAVLVIMVVATVSSLKEIDFPCRSNRVGLCKAHAVWEIHQILSSTCRRCSAVFSRAKQGHREAAEQ